MVWLETLEKMKFTQNTGKQRTSSTICAKNIQRIVSKTKNKNYDISHRTLLLLIKFSLKQFCSFGYN